MQILFACLRLAAALSLDSNLVQDPGFETGTPAWSFWARAADSGSAVRRTGSCHDRSAGCLAISHSGSQDWGVWPGLGKLAAKPGEVWRWSLWTRFDTLAGYASLSFVTRDSAGNVLSWSASPNTFSAKDTGWVRFVARISVPGGCAQIQPRLVGGGKVRLAIDDAVVAKENDVPSIDRPLVLSNDSTRVEIDPADMSMKLVDPSGTDTLGIGNLPSFHLDSARFVGDTILASVHHIPGMWSATLRAHLSGGSLRLSLRADSASVVPDEFLFPGVIRTRSGQRIVIPRGTGVSWPVDAPLSGRWTYRAAPFWDWQVSQSLSGATDGKTGFVVSVDQPSDAKMYIEAVDGGTPVPKIWQLAAKGVFGHERSVLVAPVRGGGYAELARRHRSRQDELGHVKNWSRKIAENPDVEKLRGAMDWWVFGGFSWKTFDTLRWMGMERGLLHVYMNRSSDIDSLVSRGWLVSVYDNWADAFPSDTSPNGREYAAGAIVKEDGTPMNGWLEKHADGSTRQALEICAARHEHLARSKVAQDQAKFKRNARFIDVELSVQPQECWSTVHPTDRRADMEHRLRALTVVKDSFRLVTGSEQTRDYAHAVVDYGEGPMSIAPVADAGYDWSTPEAPESIMDSISMNPDLRVPLLPLADHDAFAPTWYTGDGQSKVPARWDDKDLWNMLYATMPLIAPRDRKMWDSLRTRYMRSIDAVGALLSRCQFSAMTDFAQLSADWKVQRTVFGNGWTVAANFDVRTREEAGTSLPPKGYLATGPDGRIERAVLDGAVRTRVRLDDRWFLDPEGAEATVDGIRSSGQVFLKRLDDSTVALTLVGDQDHVDLTPLALPWPATSIKVLRRNDGSPVSVVDAGSGWSRISSSAGRYVLLRGPFGRFVDSVSPNTIALWARVHPMAGGWNLSWTQDRGASANISVFSSNGRSLFRKTIPVGTGIQNLAMPRFPQPAWIRLQSESSERILPIPRI